MPAAPGGLGEQVLVGESGLRVSALDLLIDNPANASKTLGALEFGTDAAGIFAPQGVGSAGPAMKAALDSRIAYDNGLTNYNAAFARARIENGGAQAWIFLTDGAHDIGQYKDGHRGGPPTYVIGLGIGPPGASASANRLQLIANDTGGAYYPNVDAGSLQATMNTISARLSCLAQPSRMTDSFARSGQRFAHAAPAGRTAQVVTSWRSPADRFRIDVHPGAGATVTRISQPTYELVRVSVLQGKTLRFSVRAARLSAPARAITQVSG